MARTQDEIEHNLWAEYHATRSDAARDALVEFYQPWVRRVVLGLLRGTPADSDEYVSAANTGTSGTHGLLGAITRFDPSKGAGFRTFATRYVCGAIKDYQREQDQISRRIRRASRARAQADDRHYARTGRHLSDEEMVDAVVGETVLVEATAVSTVTLSAIGSDLDRGRWEPPDPDADPVRAAQRRSLREYLCRGLNRRDRLLVTLMYFEGMNQRECAEAIGVNESLIGRMRDNVLGRLRSQIDPMALGCE